MPHKIEYIKVNSLNFKIKVYFSTEMDTFDFRLNRNQYFFHQNNMSVKYLPPYTPLLYSKTGINLFFLILNQNIDCEYLLEPPHQGGSNVYPLSMF